MNKRNLFIVTLVTSIILISHATQVFSNDSTNGGASVDIEGLTATWLFDSGSQNDAQAQVSYDDMFSIANIEIGSQLSYQGTRTAGDITVSQLQPESVASNNTDDNAITITIKPKSGLEYEPKEFSFNACRIGTNGGNFDIIATYKDTSYTIAEGVTPQLVKEEPYYSSYIYDISEISKVEDVMTIKIYIKSLAVNKQYGFNSFVLKGDISGTPDDKSSYVLNAVSADENAGEVTISPTGVNFEEGTTITVTASENLGYHFNCWTNEEEEIVSYNNPYTFDISSDTYLTANYTSNSVYSLNLTLTNGARSNLVTVDPEGEIDATSHRYEEGTDVKLTAYDNAILTFTGWEDGTTAVTRTVKMDSNKDIIANYSATDYIVAWDFYDDSPASERTADYKSDTENAGILSLRNASGETFSWLSRGNSNGNQNGKYGARIWKLLTEQLYFEMSFSTIGYSNIQVSAALGDDYNAYSTMIEEYSIDGVNYNEVGRYSLPYRSWDSRTFSLPEEAEGQSRIYVRWIPDYTSELVGVSSDYDGLTIAEIFVTADSDSNDDGTPPTLLVSNPEEGAQGVSASGAITLTFDEKIKATEGVAYLDGEEIVPIISGKTAVFRYSGLNYATQYVFTLGSNIITDRAGNGFEGITLTFTTMERTQPEARLYDAIVAQDGTGDYLTIQEAIDNAPTGRTTPWLIFIKKGIYEGHHEIPASKPFIHLIGQNKDLVSISDSRLCGGDNAYSVSEGSTMDAKASDLYFEGISFVNSWGHEQLAGPQALALYTEADRVILNRCAMLSYQDTWLTAYSVNLRQYSKECYIEGAVDFIYGQGNVVFDRDTIKIMRQSGGYIVAPNHDAATTWGYVFLDNVITAPGTPSQTSVWLGRPWHGYPKTVYINTRAEVTIPATGWYPTMGGLPARWAEYNTMDADGNPVDLSMRRTSYYYIEDNDTVWGYSDTAVLTAEQAAEYTIKNILTGDDAWNPTLITEACIAPQPVRKGNIIEWDSVPYAICYVISQGDEVVGFTTDTQYEITDTTLTVKVQATNEYGGLSQAAIAGVYNGVSNLKITQTKKSNAWYNMLGIQIPEPKKKGIYIHNDKKVSLK